jgi:hypothetical protein
MHRRWLMTGMAAAMLAGTLGVSTAQAASPTARPAPSQFVRNVDNPWFPLKPGTTFVYHGSKDSKAATDIFQATRRTKVISGVRCTVVEDTLLLNGKLEEHTIDWYAQDLTGRVWYFGERTAEYDVRGRVTSREGSWMDGVNGARAGIFMFANPKVGRSAEQEHFRGHAEDHFRVMDLSASVTVPYGTFNHALRTKEWTPLEPGIRDAKFYVHGLGEVKEVTVKGPRETLKLVQVIHD